MEIIDELGGTLEGKILFDKLTGIRESLSVAHTELAKTNLSAEVYDPISSVLAHTTLDLLVIHKSISHLYDGIDAAVMTIHDKQTEIDKLEKIIGIKENERREWAELCIRKECKIQDLKNIIFKKFPT